MLIFKYILPNKTTSKRVDLFCIYEISWILSLTKDRFEFSDLLLCLICYNTTHHVALENSTYKKMRLTL